MMSVKGTIIEPFGLQKDHRIRILYGSKQQTFGVGWR